MTSPLRSQENLAIICEQIAVGQSLTAIVANYPQLGCYDSVMSWMRDDPVAAEKYTRARQDQADWYADQVAIIAMQTPERGEHGVDSGDVAHRRLAVDSLKWLAAKRKPKVYGDKGSDVNVAVGVSVVGALSEERRNELMERRKKVMLEE